MTASRRACASLARWRSAEGHDLVHRDVPAWTPDAFAFLAEHVRP